MVKAKAEVSARQLAHAVGRQMADAFETEWARLAPNAPPYVTEYPFAQPEYQFRFDYAWPSEKVAVEVDGGNRKAALRWTRDGRAVPFAVGRHTQSRDAFKCNLAGALGWTVFHLLPETLREDPVTFVHLVLARLGVPPVAYLVSLGNAADGFKVQVLIGRQP